MNHEQRKKRGHRIRMERKRVHKDLVAAHAKSVEALRDRFSRREGILERTLLARDSLMDDMVKLVELASRIHAGDRDALGEVIAIGKRRSGMTP